MKTITGAIWNGWDAETRREVCKHFSPFLPSVNDWHNLTLDQRWTLSGVKFGKHLYGSNWDDSKRYHKILHRNGTITQAEGW